ncbi:acyl carrier protein [bacterium]|nr:acyl carrier protein [bacterium]
MDQADFLLQIDDLFENADGTAQFDSVIKDLPGWGSLTFVGLIALIDDECGVAISPGEILASVTVADLIAVIESHLESSQAA